MLLAGGAELLSAAGIASNEFIEAHKLLDEMGAPRHVKGQPATLCNRIRAATLGVKEPQLVAGSPIIKP